MAWDLVSQCKFAASSVNCQCVIYKLCWCRLCVPAVQNTHRLSLEAEEDSDNDQQGYTADESGLSDSSSGAYDDAQDDASSEASCSSTSSWTQQQQHRPVSAASALAAAGTASSAAMATSAAAEFADLPGPSLTVRVPQSALHGGSSSTGRDRQGKVSFAAGQQGQAAKHGAAAEGVGGDPTPFATAVVQQQHQASLTQHGPAVGSSSGKGGPPAGKAKGARGSGSRGGGSKHRQRMPEGLGAVLPGRGRRGLQRSHSGPAVSALKEVSSAGQVIRMAGEVETPECTEWHNTSAFVQPDTMRAAGKELLMTWYCYRWRMPTTS